VHIRLEDDGASAFGAIESIDTAVSDLERQLKGMFK
jgi:hypothetical protein